MSNEQHIARGKFITLEGIEGVGKSTQVAVVCEWLQAQGLDVVVTREPGGTLLAERLRALLLATDLPAMSHLTELLLMFAARAEHLAQVILPALARGAWVVSDRFHDASYAYQGSGRGVAEATIKTLDALVVGPHQPDLTLLLDAPVPLALGRAAARVGAPDRFEVERVDFFERVRNCYLARAQADPVRFRVLDAGGSVAQVATAVRQILREFPA